MVHTNVLGNFQFYLAPGSYCYTVTGVGMVNTSANTCYPFASPIVPGSSLAFNAISSCTMNGVYVVGPPCYATVQAALTAACAAGGGTIFLPPGSYPTDAPFTLCSDINLIGAGWGQPDVAP